MLNVQRNILYGAKYQRTAPRGAAASLRGCSLFFWITIRKARHSAPCILNSFGVPPLCESRLAQAKQSGQPRRAFLALLLLTLPAELTFHALFALPRFADRSHTLTADIQPTACFGRFVISRLPIKQTQIPSSAIAQRFLYLSLSFSCQPSIESRRSLTFFPQCSSFFVER